MMFDNNTNPEPTTSQTIAGHLPIAVLLGGAIAIFIGMHTAATTLIALGAVHVVGVLAIMGIQNLRKTRQASATAMTEDAGDAVDAKASR